MTPCAAPPLAPVRLVRVIRRRRRKKRPVTVMSFRDIGARLHMSDDTARRVFYRALRKLHRRCRALGIDPSHIVERARTMMERAQEAA